MTHDMMLRGMPRMWKLAVVFKTLKSKTLPQHKLQNPLSLRQCHNYPKRNERCSSAGTSSVSYAAPSLHLRRPILHRRLLNRSRPIIIRLTLHSSTTSSLQSRPATISAPYPPTPPLSSSDHSPMTIPPPPPPPPPTESTPSCSAASSPSLFQNPKTTRTRLIRRCSWSVSPSPRSSPSLSATWLGESVKRNCSFLKFEWQKIELLSLSNCVIISVLIFLFWIDVIEFGIIGLWRKWQNVHWHWRKWVVKEKMRIWWNGKTGLVIS